MSNSVGKHQSIGIHHNRVRNWEAFDRIEFVVVPHYKMSELSGNEWRTGVDIRFLFKGNVVHTESARDMKTALTMAPYYFIRAQEPLPDSVLCIEGVKCDQPSCCKDAIVRMRLKKLFSREGEALDMAEQHLSYYRQFCGDHLKRGDQSREDCDDNYETLQVLVDESGARI